MVTWIGRRRRRREMRTVAAQICSTAMLKKWYLGSSQIVNHCLSFISRCGRIVHFYVPYVFLWISFGLHQLDQVCQISDVKPRQFVPHGAMITCISIAKTCKSLSKMTFQPKIRVLFLPAYLKSNNTGCTKMCAHASHLLCQKTWFLLKPNKLWKLDTSISKQTACIDTGTFRRQSMDMCNMHIP